MVWVVFQVFVNCCVEWEKEEGGFIEVVYLGLVWQVFSFFINYFV